MDFKITLLPGDGIGPEVVGEAVRVLEKIAGKYNHSFNFQERLMGGCSIDKYGTSINDETLRLLAVESMDEVQALDRRTLHPGAQERGAARQCLRRIA